MGSVTIRHLHDGVIDRLKSLAKAIERSLEGEVRHLRTREATGDGRVHGPRGLAGGGSRLAGNRPRAQASSGRTGIVEGHSRHELGGPVVF